MTHERQKKQQTREPLEDLLGHVLKEHFRIEVVDPHVVKLPSPDRRGPVLGRQMAGPALVGLATVAVLAGIGVARTNGENHGATVASDTNSPVASAPTISVSTRPSQATNSRDQGELSLAQVAQVTGYKVQELPAPSGGVTEQAALAAVPGAAYAVGSAHLGLLLDTGTGGPDQYEWHDVWVVVTQTTQVPQAQLNVGSRDAPGVSPNTVSTELVSTYAIAFVDIGSGQVIREVTP